MAIIRKTENNKCWQIRREIADWDETWHPCCGKQFDSSPKMLNMELPFDATIPVLGIYPTVYR